MLCLARWRTFVIFNLSEKYIAKVGSVDCRVAYRARLYIDSVVRNRTIHHRRSSEVGCGVALQAEQVDVAVLQHVNVCPSVRDMAGRASFPPYRSMRGHTGALLVLVGRV